MSTLGYILLFTFIGSIGALIGGFILLAKEKIALKISHFLASFAAGTLLGTAFFDLLPEAAEQATKHTTDIFLWTLVGFMIFFIIERFIHWFHHHEEMHIATHEKRAILPLIIIGDTIHNFLDGIVIAATFMVNIPLGIATTFAVFAHEIPQEIGDFGLMLHKGLSKMRIIVVNIISALASFAGAIMTYILGNVLDNYIGVFLAITAGFFIYIAASDLIPEIHHERRKGYAVIETVLLIVGIIVIGVAINFFEHAH